MIAPHATPAAAYAALADFLTEAAPPLMTACVAIEYESPKNAPSFRTYSAKIHVLESEFPTWLEMHELAADEVVLADWTEANDVLFVTSSTGVEIFCLISKTTEDGAA